MASLNRVFVLGNLGQDPELRYTPNQVAVCTLNIATTDVRTDKDGNRQEQTEWHRVVVWNKQAENCQKYLSKGRSVFVEGRLQTRSWQDKEGQKRWTTEIIANNVQFLGGPSQGRDNAMRPNAPGVETQEPAYFESQANNGFGGPETPNLDNVPF